MKIFREILRFKTIKYLKQSFVFTQNSTSFKGYIISNTTHLKPVNSAAIDEWGEHS